MFDLTNKVALITGSSRGIGRAIAEQMARFGAKVVVSSRKIEACREVADAINQDCQSTAGSAVPIACNISHKEGLQILVDETHKQLGHIDILVCNAAVNPYFGAPEHIPDDAFDKIMAVNIKSNHWLVNMVLPDMRKAKDGCIIIISSIAGIQGTEVLSAYGLSKAADMAMVRNLAVTYGRENIRANAIAPGLIKTDFSKALWENPDILKHATQGAPLQRMGTPEEIAGAAVFLASDSGRFMTGQTLVIDGGATICG